MGNRALLRAVQRIAATASRLSSVKFAQFILAAPDVDVDTFRELSVAYGRLSARLSTYVIEIACRSLTVAARIGNHGIVSVGEDICGGRRDGLNSCSSLACHRSRAPQPYRPSLVEISHLEHLEELFDEPIVH
jgi:hypothetical protein